MVNNNNMFVVRRLISSVNVGKMIAQSVTYSVTHSLWERLLEYLTLLLHVDVNLQTDYFQVSFQVLADNLLRKTEF